MHFPKSLLAFALCVPSAFAIDFIVAVGRNETSGQKGIGFSPSVALPVFGDSIVFQFQSGQHSVIQSSFETPCKGSGGFTSQVFNVADNAALGDPSLPTARFLIQDTGSKWFFDQASGECNQGAIFAVNPTVAQTNDQFRQNARNSPVDPPLSTSSSTSDSSSTPTTTPSDRPTPVGSAVTTRPLGWFSGSVVTVLGYLVVA